VGGVLVVFEWVCETGESDGEVSAVLCLCGGRESTLNDVGGSRARMGVGTIRLEGLEVPEAWSCSLFKAPTKRMALTRSSSLSGPSDFAAGMSLLDFR
jgi:hypothetical protein